jgi:fumarylacetoacetase
MPLAYNGRASSVIVSGVDVSRSNGILNVDQGGCQYAASKKLDYEVEMGMFVSQPVSHGNAVAASVARNHIFGFVLLNDWSARDVQFNEMMPLGPFNGKAFATSISPWVVTLDALEDTGALVPSAPGGDVTGGSNTNNKFWNVRTICQCELPRTFLVSTGPRHSRWNCAMKQCQVAKAPPFLQEMTASPESSSHNPI